MASLKPHIRLLAAPNVIEILGNPSINFRYLALLPHNVLLMSFKTLRVNMTARCSLITYILMSSEFRVEFKA